MKIAMVLIMMVIFFVCACQQNIHKDEVIINTDKTEYKQGEEIKVELNFEGSIYEWGETGYSIQRWEGDSWESIFIGRGCHSLPDCKNANFEDVEECLGYYFCETPIWYILEEGHWRSNWIWDQKYGEKRQYQCQEVNYQWSGGKRVPVYGEIIDRECMDFKQVPIGKYKIIFRYAKVINLDDPFDREVETQYTEREFFIK